MSWRMVTKGMRREAAELVEALGMEWCIGLVGDSSPSGSLYADIHQKGHLE